MGTTAEAICNTALTMLGEEPILTLSEDNKPARFCNANYDNQRKMVLRAGRWNSATARATLAVIATAPVWGFTRAFQLPADYLRLVEMESAKERWRIQGRTILSDLSTMQITYVYDLTDVSLMEDTLQDAIASKLASILAVPLTGNRDLMRDMQAIYKDAVAEARYMNAQESSVESIEGYRWVDARVGADAVYRAIS